MRNETDSRLSLTHLPLRTLVHFRIGSDTARGAGLNRIPMQLPSALGRMSPPFIRPLDSSKGRALQQRLWRVASVIEMTPCVVDDTSTRVDGRGRTGSWGGNLAARIVKPFRLSGQPFFCLGFISRLIGPPGNSGEAKPFLLVTQPPPASPFRRPRWLDSPAVGAKDYGHIGRHASDPKDSLPTLPPAPTRRLRTTETCC